MITQGAVIGSGIMGVGIAQVLAMSHIPVRLYGRSQDALDKAKQRIMNNLKLLESHNVIPSNASGPVLDRIMFERDLARAIDNADFILESIPEKLDVKLELYATIEKTAKPDAIIASNTSTFPIKTLSQNLSRPHRFIITHFFNPAELIPLVEIIMMDSTSQSVVEATLDLLRKAGKIPVKLKKDVPGFVANRLQAAVLREALFLIQEGVVSPQDLDAIVSSGIGFRWAFLGPFEIADLGGLDTWKYVAENLFPLLDNSITPPEALCKLVDQGNLGTKTGKGFYQYDKDAVQEKLKTRDVNLLTLLKLKGMFDTA